MNWVDFFIKRHVLTWMLMIGLVFFGYFAFRQMGISEFPDVDFPVVTIDLSWEGASPELNEQQVVDAIESAISSVQGIKKIYSSSRTQNSSVTAEFELGTNIDVAVQDVQSAISRIQKKLPKNLDPPVISKTNPEDKPIMFISIITNKMTPEALMALVRDKVKTQFSTIPGVADITLAGFVDPNLRVWVDRNKLDQYFLSVTDVLSAINQEHAELPAGRIESVQKEWNVRTYGEAKSLADFASLPINARGGAPNYQPVLMGQVASMEIGLADNRVRARAMGQSSVGLGFKKQRGSNAVEVAKLVKLRMAELQQQYGDHIQFGVNFDSTRYIEDSIHEMLFTLLFSAFLTSLVCWIFLGSWGATLNVILAIPTAIVGTFIVTKACGFTLNTFTLLGLSLAIGIVVDDAIMILENITRHRSMGKDKMRSASEGTREVFFAVLATSISLIAIFLPVVFVKGIIGTYLLQFGLTLSVAIALSMLEALTLTPMRCARMLAAPSEHPGGLTGLFERGMDALTERYKKTLAFTLRHRQMTLLIAVLCFIISLEAIQMIKKEFVPYQDTNRMVLLLKAPLGVSIEGMDQKLASVEDIVMKMPELDRYFGYIGGNGDVNTARVFIQLKIPTLRPKDPHTGKRRGQRQIADALRKQLKGLKGVFVVVQDNSNRGFLERKGFPIEMSIKGPVWNHVIDYSERLKEAMKQTGFMTDVDSDYREGLPEIQIIPNRQKATQMGVSVADINRTIQAMVGGVIAGQYTQNGYRVDIRVRLKDGMRNQPTDIAHLQARNNRGELVPLSSLIDIKESKILQEITRENRERAITLTANVAKTSSQAQAMSAVTKAAKKILPPGYHVAYSGSSASFNESFRGLLLAIGLGLMVAYMVLASQFNSFTQPLMVILAMPFGISGAFLALLLGNQTLNIYSMIGLMLVLGIVLKNSIMLVDFTNQKRKEGLPVQEAIMAGCPLRLRPILMTSIATIVGASPAALALGPGAETRIPMALAVIGGVFISTLFTLFVVPCIYRLVTKD